MTNEPHPECHIILSPVASREKFLLVLFFPPYLLRLMSSAEPQQVTTCENTTPSISIDNSDTATAIAFGLTLKVENHIYLNFFLLSGSFYFIYTIKTIPCIPWPRMKSILYIYRHLHAEMKMYKANSVGTAFSSSSFRVRRRYPDH